MQGDDTEHVEALLLLSFQVRTRGCGTFGRIQRGLILKTHVGGDLTKDRCRLYRRLRIHEYAPAAEHVLVQRE